MAIVGTLFASSDPGIRDSVAAKLEENRKRNEKALPRLEELVRSEQGRRLLGAVKENLSHVDTELLSLFQGTFSIRMIPKDGEPNRLRGAVETDKPAPLLDAQRFRMREELEKIFCCGFLDP